MIALSALSFSPSLFIFSKNLKEAPVCFLSPNPIGGMRELVPRDQAALPGRKTLAKVSYSNFRSDTFVGKELQKYGMALATVNDVNLADSFI